MLFGCCCSFWLLNILGDCIPENSSQSKRAMDLRALVSPHGYTVESLVECTATLACFGELRFKGLRETTSVIGKQREQH